MAAFVSDASNNKIVKCKPYMNYDTLPEGYMRQLKIQENPNPSNIEEEIEVQLVSVLFDECPSYVTLSYTWVEPEPIEDTTGVIFTRVPRCYPVKCGGRLILCTRNLRNALRRLRQFENIQKTAPADSALGKKAASMTMFNKNIYLYWIDAICIDQEDLHERSTQVFFMDKIYLKAQCTMAWLGEQDVYTVPAVQVLLKIVGDQIAQNSFVDIGNSTKTEPKFRGIDTLDDTEISALAMLMARTWISRTWVLQEVILSPLVLTLWGGVFFSFDVFLRAGVILSISKSSLRFLGRFSEICAKNAWKIADGSISKRILTAHSTLGMIHSSRVDLQQNQKPSFMNTVIMCRMSESTDPRDKIYGILGLAAEFELGGQVIYKPDYSRTVAEVYMTATASVIRSRGDLACLILVCDCSLKNIKGLPSWCPDYTSSTPPLSDFADIARNWKLGLSWFDALHPEILETSFLRVDGSLFDVIDETSTLLRDTPPNPMKHGLSAVFNLAIQLEDRGASISTTRQHHGPFETLWRTMILDQFDNKAPAPASAADFVPAFLATLLCTIYTLDGIEPSETGIGNHTRTLATKQSVLKELQRLEEIVEKLQSDTHLAITGLPNVDRMRKWIEMFSLHRSSDADCGQTILDGLRYASAEELSLVHRAREHLDETVDLLPPGIDPFDTSLYQTLELLQRYFIGALGDGRLTRVYFRTGSTLGTGQPSIRVGDQIWFLYGALAPVVLRPLANGKYRFMGEAYVHGVMYGEAGGELRTHEPVMIE